jgi:multimeric flavodoxin WrbA
MSPRFTGHTALFINCSIKRDKSQSHTQLLMNKAAGIMESEGVDVEQLYALDHVISFGMTKDGADDGLPDDWPSIQAKIMAADILVLGTPIWLGAKSSVASLVIERMYAYSGDRNEHGQYLYYGKTAGCVITGNEDGSVKPGRARATATPPGRERRSERERHRSDSTTTSRTATPRS